jgi:mRNA interferase MazF
MVPISPTAANKLAKPSAADTFQIRSVSTDRFVRKPGDLTPGEMAAIVEAIGLVIEYPSIN